MGWPFLPMKANSGRLPRGADWVYEPKWDGHRALVRVRGERVEALSSSGQERLSRWPFLQVLAGAFRHDDVVLDGEVVALAENGHHSFQLVGRADRPHAYVVFDLLQLDDLDLTSLPWATRRRALEEVVEPRAEVFVTPVTDDADALLEATRASGFEGVIAKRTDSIYQPGKRATTWIKVKHRHEQEMVVGGYLAGEGSRAASFGSLVVGYYDGSALRCVGAVGTGFTDRTLREMWQRLSPLQTDACPFDPVPVFPQGRPSWVLPELVVQVAFGEWTEAGNIRHPVFLAMRDDKPATAVTRHP